MFGIPSGCCKTTSLLAITACLVAGCPRSPSSNVDAGVHVLAPCVTPDAGPPDDTNPPLTGFFPDEPHTVSGLARTAHMYVPQRTAGERRPLVVLLHGNGQSADQLLGRPSGAAPHKVWLDIAARERLFLVVPNGTPGPTGERGFNDCRADADTNPSTDDAAFILSLVEQQISKGADPGRIYATGLSNGGAMALRLAVEHACHFSAVAPVAALMPAASECETPRHPIALFFIHGTTDPISPFEGGVVGGEALEGRGTVLSARESVDTWRRINGVTAPEVETELPDLSAEDNSTATLLAAELETWPAVRLLRVNAGGHTEPSIQERYNAFFQLVVGRQNADVETAELVWSFFATQVRL